MRLGDARPAGASPPERYCSQAMRRGRGGSRWKSGAVPRLSPGGEGRPGSQELRSRRPSPPGARTPREGPAMSGSGLLLLLSTSDTDLLSARAAGAGYRSANPSRLDVGDLPALL